jgi:hypothetical protein
MVDICVLFVYKGVMKSINKQKEKIGAFDVFVFTNSANKVLYFIHYRRIEMKPTKEHKTILHVFIIHGMVQKFNRRSSLMSTVIWPNKKNIATKIHKETQRKRVFFYILLRVTLCNFAAKKNRRYYG